MDRFTDYGRIPCCAQKLTALPKCGATAVVMLRSLTLIRITYKEMSEWEELAASCGTVLWLSSFDADAAEWFSEKCGVTGVLSNGDLKPAFSEKYPRYLPDDKLLVLVSGLGPFLENRYSAADHPNWESAKIEALQEHDLFP